MTSRYPDLIVVDLETMGNWFYHCREHPNEMMGLRGDMVRHFNNTIHGFLATPAAVKAMCANARRKYWSTREEQR